MLQHVHRPAERTDKLQELRLNILLLALGTTCIHATSINNNMHKMSDTPAESEVKALAGETWWEFKQQQNETFSDDF